jgi:hypothetical protein
MALGSYFNVEYQWLINTLTVSLDEEPSKFLPTKPLIALLGPAKQTNAIQKSKKEWNFNTILSASEIFAMPLQRLLLRLLLQVATIERSYWLKLR